MDGSKIQIAFTNLTVARVIGYDSEHNSVYIQLASGQSPVMPARLLYDGPADQYRVHQKPLPLVGTWGIVAFPDNDDRFPVWLGAYYSTIQDGLTSSSVLQDSQIDYYSHQSGFYYMLDGFGNFYQRFPEGTDIRINGNNKPPSTYRHVVELGKSNQYGTPQIRIPFGNTERVPDVPSNFYVSLNHPSGSSLSITPSGLVTVQAGQPQLASMTITPSGIVTIQTGAGSGQTGPTAVMDPQSGTVTITGQNGHSQILMDKDGNVTVTSDGPSGVLIQSSSQIALNAAGGDIILSSSTHLESLNNIVQTFNQHTHGALTGSGTHPTPQMT